MKPSSTSLAFGGVILALLAGSHFLIVRPANQKRELLQNDIARKQAALVSFDRSTEAVRGVNAKIDGLRPGVGRFNARLESSREMNRVLEDLWRMAEANSLQTRTVKTPPEKRTDSYKEQEIELTVAGNFGGFYQFLLQLEDMQRIVRVRKLNLTKTNVRDGQVQVEMTLSVFFAPDPGEVVSGSHL